MKFGVNTFTWTASFDRGSNLPAPAGHQGGRFRWRGSAALPAVQFAAADIRKGLADNGLECTICSILTGGMNVISAMPPCAKKTRPHLQDCAKAAAEVGAKIIAGPLYSPVGLLPAAAVPRMSGSMPSNAIDP